MRDGEWYARVAAHRLRDAMEPAFEKDVPTPGMSDLQRRVEGWPVGDSDSRRDSLTTVAPKKALWESYQHYPGGDSRII